MSISSQILYIAERLDEAEQTLILELMKKLLPDDVATAEDLKDISIARSELVNGEAVDFNEIDWT
jgi:hypothetical protein